MYPSFRPLGDNALTVYFGDKIEDAIHQKVIELFYYLMENKPAYIKDVIPAYASLTVVYDVMLVKKNTPGSAYNFIAKQLEQAMLNTDEINALDEIIITIPVCYDPVVGTDLQAMSAALQIPVDEIIKIHAATVYKVYMIGFLPGFAYMGTVDKNITTPRKNVPSNIAAGSVGIAGNQTGIYPLNSPGGWNIVGQTPFKMFDATKEQSCLLQPGNRVQFQPISFKEFKAMQA